jgi:poly(A) polymerase
MSESQSLSIAAYELAAQQQKRISLPRRFTGPMREMLALQPRFMSTHGKRAMHLLEHRRFRAAYDFLILRAEVGEVDAELAKFWTNVQEKPDAERADSFQIRSEPRSQRRRRRRRKRRPKADQPS